MRNKLFIASLALMVSGCGGAVAPGAASIPAEHGEAAAATSSAITSSAATGQGVAAGGVEPASSTAHTAADGGAATAPVAGRELVNPEASTMVFLYYSLAH